MINQENLIAEFVKSLFYSGNEETSMADRYLTNSPPLPISSKINKEIPTIMEPEYFVCEEFLAPSELLKLMEYTLQRQKYFHSAQVINPNNNSSKIDYDHRRSQVLFELDELRPIFCDRIYSYLPLVFEKLRTQPFPVSKIEAQITATNDGEFFKTHNDNTHPILRTREITFVYYYHREPKAFTGGELRLYYSKFENGRYKAEGQYHTVTPMQNLIVFFKSSIMHELVKVNSPSKAFRDSRFTLNGWIHN